jgi:hypothetical protein
MAYGESLRLRKIQPRPYVRYWPMPARKARLERAPMKPGSFLLWVLFGFAVGEIYLRAWGR